MKIYVLTIGKDLYYATEDYEDAKYEKQYTEEENWQGRKQNIKLTEIEVDDTDDLDGVYIKLNNGIDYLITDILNLL